MKQAREKTEEGSLPKRKLFCLVLGVEVTGSNMREIRIKAQDVVDERGEARDGPYHVWTKEGKVVISEDALCPKHKRREYASRTGSRR